MNLLIDDEFNILPMANQIAQDPNLTACRLEKYTNEQLMLAEENSRGVEVNSRSGDRVYIKYHFKDGSYLYFIVKATIIEKPKNN